MKSRGKGAPPAFRPVQLATLVDDVPTGNAWLHEIKFDGYRCLAAVSGRQVRIHTRSGLDWTDRFTALVPAFEALDLPPSLIDGEIVALDPDGNPSFSRLQQVISAGRGSLTFFAFDLLETAGEDLASEPLVARKARLTTLVPSGDEVRLADHVIGAGEQLYRAMCRAGQEGIISKRVDSPYRGKRTRDWVKVKCTRREEFVIVGWKESEASGRPFSSLLLAQHEDDTLTYRGKVGTGFDQATLESLGNRMAGLERRTPPARVPRSESRRVHWVRPSLVAEVGYAELTTAGSLRQARFIGLREDKPASEVHPERVVAPPEAEDPVKITHPDRVLFPEAEVTKGELAEYYRAIAGLILPWLDRRPTSLVRCPQGRAKKCFFQKHVTAGFDEHVHEIGIREKDGSTGSYFHVADVAGLVGCVQMGTIEFHGWGSRVDDLERPDRMVFDLDPDEGIAFDAIRDAARHVRDHLAALGLESFALLSGGKGIHVVVPLEPAADWPTVKDFAERFARALAHDDPARYTATMSKAKRKGRIFIDWLRNQRGATSIVPYSARARPGAPVATPVTWRQLASIDSPARFSVTEAAALIRRAATAGLRGWGQARQELPEA